MIRRLLRLQDAELRRASPATKGKMRAEAGEILPRSMFPAFASVLLSSHGYDGTHERGDKT